MSQDAASPASPLAERLHARFPEAGAFAPAHALDVVRDRHETLFAPAELFAEVAGWLRDQAGFTRFVDLTCVDDHERPAEQGGRFEVQLVLYSMGEQRWARLKTRTAGRLRSVTPVFAGAHNYEREVFDLFGVRFDDHPALTRILLPDGWAGHPLRRDTPQSQEPTDFTVSRDTYRT